MEKYKFDINIYGDPWFDFSLCTLADYIERSVERRPEIGNCKLHEGRLEVEVHDEELFAEEVGSEIENSYMQNSFYNREEQTLFPHICIQPWQPPSPLRDPEAHIQDCLDSLEGGRKNCPTCGRRFKGSSERLNQWANPIATKSRAVATGPLQMKKSKTNLKVCPFCTLLGAVAWTNEALPFLSGIKGPQQRDTRRTLMLLPNPRGGNLKHLKDIRDTLSRVLINHHFMSNIPSVFTDEALDHFQKYAIEDEEDLDARTLAVRTDLLEPEAGLLLLYSSVGRFVKDDEFREGINEIRKRRLESDALLGEEIDIDKSALDLVIERWIGYEIPSTRMKNITGVEIPFTDRAAKRIERFEKADVDIITGFLSRFGAVSDGKEVKQERIREYLSDSITSMAKGIMKGSLAEFSAGYVPRGGISLTPFSDFGKKLTRILTLWGGELSLDEENVKTLKNAAWTLASLCEDEVEVSRMLYSLDRVRGKSELTDFLAESMRRAPKAEEGPGKAFNFKAVNDLTEQVLTVNEQDIEDYINALKIFLGTQYIYDRFGSGQTEEEQ